MCAVFCFHCARFFDDGGWHVKNAQDSFGMTVFVTVLAQWIMPIFFIFSGMSTYYSLGKKEQGWAFLRERFKRVMVPFIIGIFTMIPLQVYFERISHSQFSGTFFDFFPHYFDGFYGFGGNFAWMGLHLWYLLFLFIFCLLTLPLFTYSQKSAGQRLLISLADVLAKPGIIFLLFVPITLLDFILMPNMAMGIRDMGGWNLITYLLLYIYGYFLASDTRYKEIIQTHRHIALVIYIVTLLALYYVLVYTGRPQTGYNLSYLLLTAGRCLNSWCFILAFLGYGSKYLTVNNSLLSYVNQLILPFYILHQTVIITIGFYVVQWDVNITTKYLIISISSLAVVMVLYEFFIRQIKILRFFFGMK